MDIHTFLVTIHLFGAVLGVGAATFAEIFYLKSIKDGEIDPIEGSFLKTTYLVLRIGLVILILSGFGFLIYYRIIGTEELLFDPKIWAKLSIVFIIITNAVLIQIRKIPIWLGAPISLASWYAAFIIGMLNSSSYSYSDLMVSYIIFVGIMAIILELIKKVYIKNA